MYFVQVPYASPAYDETVRLRDAILRKPLGLEFPLEQLAAEWQDLHFGFFTNADELVGCLIFSPQDQDVLKMRQVAVWENYQNQGLGQKMVLASEKWAMQNGYNHIVLHARKASVSFYMRLDYQKEGKEFTEVGIPHFKMHKKLKALK